MIENGEFLVGKRHQSYLWDQLKVTSLGPYRKNNWVKFADKKLFSGVDFAELGDVIIPNNYQQWLNLYYGIIAEKYALESPIDLTINQAVYSFSKRPLWAQTFSEKKFLESVSRPETFVSMGINDWDINHWWAEREMFTDPKGSPVIVERTLSTTGALQDLCVLAGLGIPGHYRFRVERRVSRSRFEASGFQEVFFGGDASDLLRSNMRLSRRLWNLPVSHNVIDNTPIAS